MTIELWLISIHIYMCSVLGTLVIVVGLYTYLWGKDRELKVTVAAAAAAQEDILHNQQGEIGSNLEGHESRV